MALSLTKTLRTIFRDYVVDGVSSSGKNIPSKFDLRQWGDEIEASAGLAQIVVDEDTSVQLNRLEIARRSVMFLTTV